jgi:hypothetical protein
LTTFVPTNASRGTNSVFSSPDKEDGSGEESGHAAPRDEDEDEDEEEGFNALAEDLEAAEGKPPKGITHVYGVCVCMCVCVCGRRACTRTRARARTYSCACVHECAFCTYSD